MIDAGDRGGAVRPEPPQAACHHVGGGPQQLGLQAADKLLVSASSRNPPPPLKALPGRQLATRCRRCWAERAAEATVAQVEAAQRFDPLQQKLSEIDRLQQRSADLKTQHYTPVPGSRIAGEVERVQKELRGCAAPRPKGRRGNDGDGCGQVEDRRNR